MSKYRNKFVWMSIVLELSLLLGASIYFLAHQSIQASENEENQVSKNPITQENQNITNEQSNVIKKIPAKNQTKSVKINKTKTYSPTNIGGPYTVCPPLHVGIYHAKKGDNMATIAKKNNLDLFTILSVNGLKTANNIHIGQRLKIPNQRGIFHEVKKGQTLEDIALMYNVNLRKIIRVNQILDPSEIKPGIELFIPDARTTVAFQRELLEKSGIITKKEVGNEYKIRSSRSRSLFSLPCKGVNLTSGFGYRRDPFNGGREFHAGVDLAPGYGSPVYAAMDGIVTYAGWMGGYGKLVVITSKNGYSTRYGHLSRISVRNGSYVKQGQRIGNVGNTGRSTGPHLHFEIRKNDKPINPLRYLKIGK